MGTGLWSQEIHGNKSNFLSETLQKQLSESKEIFNILHQGELPKAMPFVSCQEQIIEDIKQLKPSIGVEILTFFPYPEKSTDSENLQLYNILNNISSLKDIEYYSASRKRMRVFYHDAFMVESEKSSLPLKDTQFTSIPQDHRITAYFKDSSFGNYYSEILYQYDGKTFNMRMENLSQIWYFVLPLLEPGGMVSSVTIIPTEEGIIFYGLSYLKILNLFGLADDRIDSLYNRMKAIYTWFTGKL